MYGGKKTVQSMEELFGMVGRFGKGKELEGDALQLLGKKRSLYAGGALAGGAIMSRFNSSARNGLQPRSSAPPPGAPPMGY